MSTPKMLTDQKLGFYRVAFANHVDAQALIDHIDAQAARIRELETAARELIKTGVVVQMEYPQIATADGYAFDAALANLVLLVADTVAEGGG